jgi:hypothetical protein
MLARTRLRRLAAYVLLAWLFGLASGIANACVLGSDSRHAAHGSAPVVHEHGMAMDDSTGHAGHEHQGHHGKLACERLCDAPVAARTADNELGSVLAGFWLAPAPLPSASFHPVDSGAETAAPDAAPSWRPGIPLPIAFLRLTL